MNLSRVRVVVAFAWLVAGACSSAPRARVASAIDARDVDGALDRYLELEREGVSDASLLAEISTLVLEREAMSASDERTIRDAIAGLRGRTEADMRALERLSQSASDEVAVQAIVVRGARDQDRERLEHVMSSGNPRLAGLAARLLAVGWSRDRAEEVLRDRRGEVRAEALRAFDRVTCDAVVIERLDLLARSDPAVNARVAALRQLGKCGAPAFDRIVAHLTDREDRVSIAAIEALVRADPDRAAERCATLLGEPPTTIGITCASAVLRDEENRANAFAEHPEDRPPIAVGSATLRGYLVRAVRATGARDWMVAFVAARSLRRDDTISNLFLSLASDESPRVRVAVAMALLEERSDARRARGRALAWAWLRGEGAGESTFERISALNALAIDGDEEAAALVRAAAIGDDEEAALLAAPVAARHLRESTRLVPFLRDRSARRRIAVAAALTAASDATRHAGPPR